MSLEWLEKIFVQAAAKVLCTSAFSSMEDKSFYATKASSSIVCYNIVYYYCLAYIYIFTIIHNGDSSNLCTAS